MLAIADGRPETLGLKQTIEHFLDFQYEIYTRKYQKLLAKELEKREIQEGLMRAVDIIDLIIEILRGSKNINQARACLTEGNTEGIRFKTKKSEKEASRLNFTLAQANAILEMRLYKLIGLELDALMKDHDETLKHIAEYQDILENHDSMSKVIVSELDKIKRSYSRPRRTSIENAREVVLEEKKLEEMPIVLLVDRFGYTRTIDQPTFERNQEAAVSESKYIINCMNTDRIAVFTDIGKVHLIKATDFPFGRFRDKAVPIDNICNFDSSTERIIQIFPLPQILNSKLLFVTAAGMLKQVEGSQFDASKRTIAATKLGDGDTLLVVIDTGTYNQVVLQTAGGFFLKFPLINVPEMKKTAVGVKGITLAAKDQVEAVYPLDSALPRSITYNEKEVSLGKLKLAGRGGKGTKIRVK